MRTASSYEEWLLGDGMKGDTMVANLSVVVCCSNDFDLAHALDSVDDAVEIIASITPNRMIERYLELKEIPHAVSRSGITPSSPTQDSTS